MEEGGGVWTFLVSAADHSELTRKANLYLAIAKTYFVTAENGNVGKDRILVRLPIL